MIFFNRKKKKFYKKLIAKIQRSIWDMELRIITIKEIREGIRRELDKISDVIKAQEQQLEKMCEENKIPIEKLEVMKVSFDPKPGQSNEEWGQDISKSRKERWKGEINKMLEAKHGEERKKLEEKLMKEGGKILTIYEIKAGLETDAEKMKNQMVGKWSEKEQAHIGGIDQETKEVESKIAGGKSFQGLIIRQLKKL